MQSPHGTNVKALEMLSQGNSCCSDGNAWVDAWVTVVADEDAGMPDDGYGTPDEGENIDPAKMTIGKIKDWLTEHGHEDKAYELASNKKAKKGDYVAVMENVLGSPSRRQ